MQVCGCVVPDCTSNFAVCKQTGVMQKMGSDEYWHKLKTKQKKTKKHRYYPLKSKTIPSCNIQKRAFIKSCPVPLCRHKHYLNLTTYSKYYAKIPDGTAEQPLCCVKKVTLQQRQSRSKSLEYQTRSKGSSVGLKVQCRDTKSV